MKEGQDDRQLHDVVWWAPPEVRSELSPQSALANGSGTRIMAEVYSFAGDAAMVAMHWYLPLVILLITLPIQAEEKAADPATYRVLGCDRGKVAIVTSKGKVEWEYKTGFDGHDVHQLPSGNLLFATSWTRVVEMTPEKKVVWEYNARPKTGYRGRVEIHAFQRLDKGVTMIAESGNQRIVEVDNKGKILVEVPLLVEKPNAHHDTRMVRKLDNGHYLVCHEADGKVCEYDGKGKVVWTFTLDLGGRLRSAGHGPEGHGTDVYGAIRLANGNTLISGGNNNRVLEVTPAGKTVWSLGHDELPGIRLAWVTTLHVLPSGNIIIGNCHAGARNPQLFEVTKEKKVVWSFNDQKTFGNGLAAVHVLGLKGAIKR